MQKEQKSKGRGRTPEIKLVKMLTKNQSKMMYYIQIKNFFLECNPINSRVQNGKWYRQTNVSAQNECKVTCNHTIQYLGYGSNSHIGMGRLNGGVRGQIEEEKVYSVIGKGWRNISRSLLLLFFYSIILYSHQKTPSDTQQPPSFPLTHFCREAIARIYNNHSPKTYPASSCSLEKNGDEQTDERAKEIAVMNSEHGNGKNEVGTGIFSSV